ncbi:MAG: FAD-binding oxidoreductase, partial [bacterium]|nr:FAD-binding oxidoreductase [bacterium]
MREKKTLLTNFSRALSSESFCVRPDDQEQLIEYLAINKPNKILARGSGLSYSDSCLNQNGLIIDMNNLNHLLDFDVDTGIAQCEAGTPFKDLFLFHPQFIPPVLPGTLNLTVGGAIAHDVHGKNNPTYGSMGHHISWFTLLINNEIIRCSREENAALFYATIGGLGLTGIIIRVAIRLIRASRGVEVENKPFTSLAKLLDCMKNEGVHCDYQVAWLDLLHNTPKAILSLAKHCDAVTINKPSVHNIPKLPFSLLKPWNLKWFNQFFFHSKKPREKLPLVQFNNPLDKLNHWNRLYGPKGLIQFQAVFDRENAYHILKNLLDIIKNCNATPTLAVLKLFTQSGEGLLSFCQPGFTVAIDFFNSSEGKD